MYLYLSLYLHLHGSVLRAVYRIDLGDCFELLAANWGCKHLPGSDKMQRRDYKWATTPRIICICNTNTNWIKVFQQNTSTREKCLPFPECSMVVFLNFMFVHCPMIIPTSGYCPSVHYLSPISPCWWPCHHHVTMWINQQPCLGHIKAFLLKIKRFTTELAIGK